MVYSWASRSMRPMKQGQHLQMREPDSSTNWGKDNWHRALPSLERISCLTSGSRMQILFVFRCEWCSPSCSRCQRPSFPWSNFWRVKLRKLQNSQYTACVKMMFEDLCVHSLAGPNLFARGCFSSLPNALSIRAALAGCSPFCTCQTFAMAHQDRLNTFAPPLWLPKNVSKNGRSKMAKDVTNCHPWRRAPRFLSRRWRRPS